ncbi:hypothetical protein THUN1379_25860 [Paludibacterium sp. THUN1379]|uniref:hypothetical protein n=1 Tax=Paludibacterium sp. THUN1379 TaxID=3112107 RepID=UPI00308C92AA|nr:hypothetical protein THUN1379_25860 [Paludibacterium sp. THUN1379]
MYKLDMSQAIQKQLIFAVLDDFCPNGALSNFFGGQYGNNQEKWALAVIDFIYNAMGLDLIAPMQCLHEFEKLSTDEVRALLVRSRAGPNLEKDEDLAWDILYLCGTEKLRLAAEKFDLSHWEALNQPVNEQFFDYINTST